MPDLRTMNGIETVEWLQRNFAIDPTVAGSAGRDARGINTFTSHGITDTDLIVEHIEQADVLATLPAGTLLAADQIDDLLLVGGTAWVEDEENRSDWASVGKASRAHEASIAAANRFNRKDPSGKSRHSLRPHEVVTAFYEAGRGPAYARTIIALANRHRVEIDAYGFGAEISPATFEDLASSGVQTTAELDGYAAAGLDLREAIAHRNDDIAPTAVLMALREGHPRSLWRELLAGIPSDWFRPLGNDAYATYGATETPTTLTHHLRVGGNDRYTLADLRYLADHGWKGDTSLAPDGVTELPRYGGGAVAPGAIATCARNLADHGLTWAALGRWADALTVGKAPTSKWSPTTPPLIGHGGPRRGSAAIPAEHLPEVFALHEAGLRPSHMPSYRKAGCRSIAHVLDAVARGITPAVAEALCKNHGRQPDRSHSTRVIDDYADLVAAHVTV